MITVAKMTDRALADMTLATMRQEKIEEDMMIETITTSMAARGVAPEVHHYHQDRVEVDRPHRKLIPTAVETLRLMGLFP